MGKKDGGAKKALALERKREKQHQKAAKKQKKQAGTFSLTEEEEEDIFEQLKKWDAKPAGDRGAAGRATPCARPGPRAACSLTPLPGGTSDYLLFGGEFNDGKKVHVYNETYRCNFEKNEFKLVECPVSPKPRCSHQCAVYKDDVFMYGGEFATMEQFYHFKDVWKFDHRANAWAEVATTGGGPGPRSGHRVAVYKHFLVVFGGFYDALREIRYYNDVHLLNLQTMHWARVALAPGAAAPSPRSGVLMAACAAAEGVVVCGGYCKVKDSASGAQGEMLRDAWWLDMRGAVAAAAAGAAAGAAGGPWEKLGKKAHLPTLRVGVTGVAHKSMLVCFGGVCDEGDEGGTRLGRSVFYNDLHCFDMVRKRWHLLKIEPKEGGGKRGAAGGGAGRKPDAAAAAAAAAAGGAGAERSNATGAGAAGAADDRWVDSSDDEDWEHYFGYIGVDGRMVRIRIDKEEALGGGRTAPAEAGAAAAAAADGGAGGAAGERRPGGEEASPLKEGSPPMQETALETAGLREKHGLEESALSTPTAGESRTSPSAAKCTDVGAAELASANSHSSGRTKKKMIDGGGGAAEFATPAPLAPQAAAVALAAAVDASSDAAASPTSEAPPPAAPAPSALPPSALLTMDTETPLPRLNASLALRPGSSDLLVYGGILELGRREVTLDDCWSVKLNTRKKWECLMRGRLDEHPWLDAPSSEDEESDEEESDERSEEGSAQESGAESESSASTAGQDSETDDSDDSGHRRKKRVARKKNAVSLREELAELRERFALEEAGSTPRVGEPLKDFFERTRTHWCEQLLSSAAFARPVGEKEIKKAAFELASVRFEAVAPTLARIAEIERVTAEGGKEKKRGSGKK